MGSSGTKGLPSKGLSSQCVTHMANSTDHAAAGLPGHLQPCHTHLSPFLKPCSASCFYDILTFNLALSVPLTSAAPQALESFTCALLSYLPMLSFSALPLQRTSHLWVLGMGFGRARCVGDHAQHWQGCGGPLMSDSEGKRTLVVLAFSSALKYPLYIRVTTKSRL